MAAEDVKALRQVQEVGRLRATGSPMADQMKYALENKLPEEHFQKVFNRSREEAQNLLDSGFGEREAAKSAETRSRINLERPPGQAPSPNAEIARLRAQRAQSQTPREMVIDYLGDNEHIIHGAEAEVRNIVGDANISNADGLVDYRNLSDEQLARLRDFAEDQNRALERMGEDVSPSIYDYSSPSYIPELSTFGRTELGRGEQDLMNYVFGGTEGLTQEELRERISRLEREMELDDLSLGSIDDEESLLIDDDDELIELSDSPEGESLRARFRELDAADDAARSTDYVSGSYRPDYENIRSDRVRSMIDRFDPSQYVRNMEDEGITSSRRMNEPREFTIYDPGRGRALKRNISDKVNKIDKKLENFLNKNL